MQQVDTLVICGASVTFSPWLTWKDVAEQVLKPRNLICIGARGVGNKWIALALLSQINELEPGTLVMPMFTAIDKYDMYLDRQDLSNYLAEKHKPLSLTGKYASQYDDYAYWSTGSHWPENKQQYKHVFWREDDAMSDTIIQFAALESACAARQIKVIPSFDIDIWNYFETDYLALATEQTPLRSRRLLHGPVAAKIQDILGSQWFDHVSLIDYAIDKGQNWYLPERGMHPPSQIHFNWFNDCVLPRLDSCLQYPVDRHFREKIQTMSEAW